MRALGSNFIAMSTCFLEDAMVSFSPEFIIASYSVSTMANTFKRCVSVNAPHFSSQAWSSSLELQALLLRPQFPKIIY